MSNFIDQELQEQNDLEIDTKKPGFIASNNSKSQNFENLQNAKKENETIENEEEGRYRHRRSRTGGLMMQDIKKLYKMISIPPNLSQPKSGSIIEEKIEIDENKPKNIDVRLLFGSINLEKKSDVFDYAELGKMIADNDAMVKEIRKSSGILFSHSQVFKVKSILLLKILLNFSRELFQFLNKFNTELITLKLGILNVLELVNNSKLKGPQRQRTTTAQGMSEFASNIDFSQFNTYLEKIMAMLNEALNVLDSAVHEYKSIHDNLFSDSFISILRAVDKFEENYKPDNHETLSLLEFKICFLMRLFWINLNEDFYAPLFRIHSELKDIPIGIFEENSKTEQVCFWAMVEEANTLSSEIYLSAEEFLIPTKLIKIIQERKCFKSSLDNFEINLNLTEFVSPCYQKYIWSTVNQTNNEKEIENCRNLQTKNLKNFLYNFTSKYKSGSSFILNYIKSVSRIRDNPILEQQQEKMLLAIDVKKNLKIQNFQNSLTKIFSKKTPLQKKQEISKKN